MRGVSGMRGLSPRRRAMVATVTLLALAAAATVAVRLAAGGSGPADFPSQTRLGTVLLVPGYGGSRASLSQLADRIGATGRTASVITLPGDGTGDLLAQARQLDAAVTAALAAGAPSVDVIGYSAGGVVVRLWVARDAGAHRARRVVTLGAPLHGAAIAGVGAALVPGACPVACQQLVPGSALLGQLDESPLPPQLPWLSVWTTDDQTVTPPESARLAGAVNVPVQRVCPDARVAHGQLPTDPLVIGLVLRAVSSAPLSAPPPADCAALRAAGAAPAGR